MNSESHALCDHLEFLCHLVEIALAGRAPGQRIGRQRLGYGPRIEALAVRRIPQKGEFFCRLRETGAGSIYILDFGT